MTDPKFYEEMAREIYVGHGSTCKMLVRARDHMVAQDKEIERLNKKLTDIVALIENHKLPKEKQGGR